MSLVDRVGAWLAPGGGFSQRWPGYERRDAQEAFARDVARTLEQGGVLLAEAPTGVGKSLAYLLPAVLLAIENDTRVVVATCTRSLQDQLVERDLPALLAAMNLTLPVAVLKGKSNYLCPRALELAEPDGDEEREALDALHRWAATDEVGDLDRFAPPDAEAFRRLRPRVATDPGACTAATCRRGRECFWVRARRRAAEARLTIVNHALLARAAEAEGLLPEAEVLIIDEAHRLEGVLSSQLEKSVSRHRVDELLRQTGRYAAGKRTANALLGQLRVWFAPLLDASPARAALVEDLERLGARADALKESAARLFAQILPPGANSGPYGARKRYRSLEELLRGGFGPLDALVEHARAFAGTLRRAGATVSLTDSGGRRASEGADVLAGELELVSARWSALADDVEDLAHAQNPAWVYWVSASARSLASVAPAGELHGAPVSVADDARRLLFTRPRAVVLASATLSAAGDFTWAAERLGFGEEFRLPYQSAIYPSPFPLERQMRSWVHESPNDEAQAVADVVAALAQACRHEDGGSRSTLVLFTAHERLRRTRGLLASMLPADVPLLAQELDGPAAAVIDRFRMARGAVLLGVQSLWEGVDFPGDALEVLVVAKLPFSVPDEPIVEARAERLRERGVDPFRGDALPEAVMRFRQGVGRLIRRLDDRGVLVVCDARLATARYRRAFVEALPAEPVRASSTKRLAADAARFLAASTTLEDR